MDPNVAVMGAIPRTGIHPQRQKIFLCHGFPAAPGMPRADPGVLGTVASGKNVWFKIARPQFQRDFLLSPKSENHYPPPPSETDRKAVGISHELMIKAVIYELSE